MGKGKLSRAFRFVFFGSGLAALGIVLYVQQGTQPTPPTPEKFIRFDKQVSMRTALAKLESMGFVKSATAFRIAEFVWPKPKYVRAGTYSVQGGLDRDEVYRALSQPIRQMVRLPETNWARRSANLLERANVTTAKEYMDAWGEPQRFQAGFSLPLPTSGTLEGFLYPDTYDLPPLLGAEGTIRRQLSAFEKRVKPHVKDAAKLYRTLIVASMVELEVAKDSERPIVAGVIENRLRLGMKLQIDATINYGLQEWRALTYADLKKDGPYNTYTRAGLPPTPICSPSLKSILAAMRPAKHNYLYYVAMPEKYHLFSATFDEHRRNIARRKAALKAIGK